MRLRTWASDTEAVNALIDARAERINRARGLLSKPYDHQTAKATAKAKRGRPRLKGYVNLKEGVIHYSREGYEWVNGSYVKVDPGASGVTHRYGQSRHDRRLDAWAWQHPKQGRSTRAKRKQAAREAFWANRRGMATHGRW